MRSVLLIINDPDTAHSTVSGWSAYGTACAGDAPVEHVEHERERQQRGGGEQAPRLTRFEVRHGREDRHDAAGGIAERQKIREVEPADHRQSSRRRRRTHAICTLRITRRNGPASLIARCFTQRLSQNATAPWVQRKRHVNSGRLPCSIRKSSNGRRSSSASPSMPTV